MRMTHKLGLCTALLAICATAAAASADSPHNRDAQRYNPNGYGPGYYDDDYYDDHRNHDHRDGDCWHYNDRRRYYDSNAAKAHVERRLARQKQRLTAGKVAGDLTKRELRFLRRNYFRIGKRLNKFYRRDRHLSYGEFKKLSRMLDRSSQQIRQARRNYERNDHYGNRPYYTYSRYPVYK